MVTWIAGSLLTGCGPDGLHDATFHTGSTTVVSKARTIYAVNAFDGTLGWTDMDDGGHQELVVGGEPTRIAVVGKDELWVTLRAERAIVVFDTHDGDPVEVARLTTGAEPYGIVATEDGSRVYVALSQADAVAEFDGKTHAEIRRWTVHDDPRWLALHPSDRALFVVYGYDPRITRIDLVNGEMQDRDPPETSLPHDDDPDVDLNSRPTGDPAVSPMGDVLIVPTLFVDNETAGEQPEVVGQDVRPPTVPYYTSETSSIGTQLSLGKFNPALVGVSLSPRDGTIVDDEPMVPVFVGGFDQAGPIRGYVASVTFDPDGYTVYAAIEAADAVIAVDLRPVEGQGMDPSVRGSATGGFGGSGSFRGDPPSIGGFYERAQVVVDAAANPAGVTVDDRQAPWVFERGARSVATLPLVSMRDTLNQIADGTPVVGRGIASARRVVGVSKLPDDVEAGRKLFYSATDAKMAAVGAGVSCSTCHFEGRNDGMTWQFDDAPRQTPSLAGPVSLTAPVTWTLAVPTVSMEAQITSAGRMGGAGLGAADAANLAAFIDWTRDVDTSNKGHRDELATRGAELFAREDVGCAECHSGGRYTDNGHHVVFGMDVNTPGLVGVDATAPYFHDGSAPTLRAVLERVRDGSMGSTAALSDDDLTALEAFLRTL